MAYVVVATLVAEVMVAAALVARAPRSSLRKGSHLFGFRRMSGTVARPGTEMLSLTQALESHVACSSCRTLGQPLNAVAAQMW